MNLRRCALFLVPLLVQACNSLEVVPGKFNGDISQYKGAYISEVVVTSEEADADELAQNKAIEVSARTKIEEALTKKHLAALDAEGAQKSRALVFNFKSSINYGSRAARYFAAGFTSAGRGTVSSKFEAVDSVTKQVVYSSSAESVLKAGIAGGGMDSIIEENIDELLEGFVNPED